MFKSAAHFKLPRRFFSEKRSPAEIRWKAALADK